MNRIRGEGGRFNSGSRRSMETQAGQMSPEDPLILQQQQLDDIKPDTVSITIIQNEELQENQSNQWRRLAPQPMQST
ncbi:unnamed protein product [Colias eurytheme]|nr:unnamed protein product [Colias eurytheme]